VAKIFYHHLFFLNRLLEHTLKVGVLKTVFWQGTGNRKQAGNGCNRNEKPKECCTHPANFKLIHQGTSEFDSNLHGVDCFSGEVRA